MKMPFGKYKGEDLEDLPTSYLYWMAENMDSHPQLQQEAKIQLKLRKGQGVPRKEVK